MAHGNVKIATYDENGSPTGPYIFISEHKFEINENNSIDYDYDSDY